MNIILDSNLHFRVIQTKLTPHLASLTDGMQEEIEFALKNDFPSCDGKLPCQSSEALADSNGRSVG
jgi:hypothetical protein